MYKDAGHLYLQPLIPIRPNCSHCNGCRSIVLGLGSAQRRAKDLSSRASVAGGDNGSGNLLPFTPSSPFSTKLSAGSNLGTTGLALGRDLRLLLQLHLEGRRLGWSPGCPRDQPHSSSSPRLLFFCPFGVFFSGCACSLRVTILHLSVLKADGDRPRCRCHHHLQPSAGKIKMQNEIKMHNLAGPKGRQVEGHGGVRAI